MIKVDNGIRHPKTKTGLKTFNKIIEVSKELFANNGFSQTSINQIIENAGIATGTFYIYFDDKKAIYNFLLADYSKKIRKRVNDAIKDLPTREEKEFEGLKTYIKFALEDKLVYRIILEALFIETDLFIEYYTNFSKHYSIALNQAVLDGEVDPNVNIEVLSYVLMGISSFLGLKVVFLDQDNPGGLTDEKIDEIARSAMYVLKNGMFTKK